MSSASFFCLLLILGVSAAETDNSKPKATTESSNIDSNPLHNGPDLKKERILGDHCAYASPIDGSCGGCEPGYHLDATKACVLDACVSGFLFDTTGACISSTLTNCNVVEANNGLVCHTCADTYKLSAGTCVVSCSSNCASCSASNVCTQCNTNYFLYDNNADTTCISCQDSCSSCTASPNCYVCASLIVQDGNTCRADSLGYQLSFDEPNVIVDFAHSSTRVYSIDKVTAKKADLTVIDTTTWKIGARTNSQVKILTDNLHLSDLPVDINLTFT